MFAEGMMGVCYRFTKNIADAEDVLQEGFIKVFTRLHTLQEVHLLAGWIKTLMVHECIDFLRKKKTVVFTNNFEQEPIIQNAEVLSKLQFADLLELIRKLPYGYQTVFNLYALDGYSHKEIAAILGISEGASKSQYARAKAKLILAIDQENKIQKNHATIAP